MFWYSNSPREEVLYTNYEITKATLQSEAFFKSVTDVVKNFYSRPFRYLNAVSTNSAPSSFRQIGQITRKGNTLALFKRRRMHP